MKKRTLLVIGALMTTSAVAQVPAKDAERARIEQRISAARANTGRMAQEEAGKAGNPLSPQIVEEDQIPSFERLTRRFQLGAEQLKPEFVVNMLVTDHVGKLAAMGCRAEMSLPAGVEFEPGRLDGMVSLFRCGDGAYGILEIKQPFAHPKIRKELVPEALNDSIGTTPAVGRYRATASGRTSSMLRWDDSRGMSFTLDLVAPASVRTAKSLEGGNSPAPARRIKEMAASIGAIAP